MRRDGHILSEKRVGGIQSLCQEGGLAQDGWDWDWDWYGANWEHVNLSGAREAADFCAGRESRLLNADLSSMTQEHISSYKLTSKCRDYKFQHELLTKLFVLLAVFVWFLWFCGLTLGLLFINF